MPDLSTTTLYANDSIGGVASGCSAPLTYVVAPEQGAGAIATSTFNLHAAVKRCRRKFKENKKVRARCVRRAKRHARALRS